MKKIDYLGLDGRTLKTFLIVLEECSVSKAAERLNTSQSTVSHTLDKLRLAFKDQLFVRFGRGIEPTTRALSLRVSVETILSNLESLTYDREFNPQFESIEFTIATNDFPLGLIFPTLLKELYTENIFPQLDFIPSGIPSANLLRLSKCHMSYDYI